MRNDEFILGMTFLFNNLIYDDKMTSLLTHDYNPNPPPYKATPMEIKLELLPFYAALFDANLTRFADFNFTVFSISLISDDQGSKRITIEGKH